MSKEIFVIEAGVFCKFYLFCGGALWPTFISDLLSFQTAACGTTGRETINT